MTTLQVTSIEDFLVNYEARSPGSDKNVALLVMAIARLARIIEQDLQQTLKESGLTRTELAVLSALWLAGDDAAISPTWLSKSIVQTTSGMTKTLRRLSKMGLIELVPDEMDGRGRIVKLTASGARIAMSDSQKTHAHWSEIFGQLDQDLTALADDMGSLLVGVEKILGSEV